MAGLTNYDACTLQLVLEPSSVPHATNGNATCCITQAPTPLTDLVQYFPCIFFFSACHCLSSAWTCTAWV